MNNPAEPIRLIDLRKRLARELRAQVEAWNAPIEHLRDLVDEICRYGTSLEIPDVDLDEFVGIYDEMADNILLLDEVAERLHPGMAKASDLKAPTDRVSSAMRLLVLLEQAETAFTAITETLSEIDRHKFTRQVTGNDIVCDLARISDRLPIEIRALARHLLGRLPTPTPDDRPEDHPPF